MNDYNSQYRPGGFGYLPVVTKNIIIINVLLFLATLVLRARGIDLVAYLGLHHHLATDFRPHQFITYIFMHGSFTHLAFNMFGVYIFGQVLEQVWGSKRYLNFYILTGLGAALAQYVILNYQVGQMRDLATLSNPGSSAVAIDEMLAMVLNSHVIIGASGSLFGLLGAFGMLFPNRYIYLYFMIPVKAKWMVTFYGLAELYSAIQNNPEDNIGHLAHIGGLLVGILIVLIWRRDRNQFY